MKLRNLMYATMIACAFASCSKDDVKTPGDGTTNAGTGDANLSISISLVDVATKAETDKNAFEGETTINNIVVAIFQDNNLLGTASSSTTTTAKDKVTFTGLPSKTDLRCIVLANMDKDLINGLTPEALTKSIAISSPNGFVSGNLPMFALTEAFQLNSGNNADKIIPVYRNVARVQLSAINLNMGHESSKYASGKATFELNSVSMNSAAENGNIDGSAWNTSPTFVSGFAGYKNSNESYVPYFHGDINGFSIEQSNFGEPVAMENLAVDGIPVHYFYVFANTDDDNLSVLTVAGKFGFEGKTKDGSDIIIKPKTSYYPIIVGYDGVVENPAKQVVKNMVYDIQLNIAGSGYSKPDPTDPDAKDANFSIIATVAKWANVIRQDHTIN